MEKRYKTTSAQETAEIGKELAAHLSPGLVTLSGDLGAGKTKLSGGILAALGAEGPYQSPTFTLIKEYHLDRVSPSGIARVYHADAYRLEEKDFAALGFHAFLEDSEGLMLLEWPEKVKNSLPEKRIDITLTQVSETEREIFIQYYGY